MIEESVIETKRLIIREFVPEDLDDLYRLYQESDAAFLEPLSPNREEELEKLESYIHYIYGFYGFGLWAVCRKTDGRLIGRCGLQVEFIGDQGDYELGYMIGSPYQGMGYGREAVQAILAYGFDELEAPRILLRIETENQASLKFAEALGFKRNDKIKSRMTGFSGYIYEL